MWTINHTRASRNGCPFFLQHHLGNGNSYRGGYSNRYSMRGRDSMGRYSRNSYRGYSREGEHDDMMEKLERMMRDANSETERQVLQRVMNQM